MSGICIDGGQRFILMQIFTYTLAGIILAGFGVYFYFRHFEKSHVYHPVRKMDGTPETLGLPYEDIYFHTQDQVKLHGWYIPFPNAKVTLLIFHGNFGNISHRLDQIQFLHHLEVNLFIFDYRGYGSSKGILSEEGTYQDALAAWNYLHSRTDMDPYKVILFGRSLGGALAIDLASKVKPLGLIVESTFTSVMDIGKELYPHNPITSIATIHYDSISKIGKVRCPVMICHSNEDDMIPFTHAERLFETAHSPKQFFMLKGNHNEGGEITGEPYRKSLAEFVQQCLEDD